MKNFHMKIPFDLGISIAYDVTQSIKYRGRPITKFGGIFNNPRHWLQQYIGPLFSSVK
jgi:hypothetical protein